MSTDLRLFIEVLHQSGLFPDFDGFINALLFMIIAGAFLIIVVGSQRYRHLLDYLDDYF